MRIEKALEAWALGGYESRVTQKGLWDQEINRYITC